MSTRDGDPFRAVHRARRRRAVGVGAAGALAAALVVATVWMVPAAVASSSLPVAPVGSGAAPAHVPAAEPVGSVAAEAPWSAVLAAPATVITTPDAAPPEAAQPAPSPEPPAGTENAAPSPPAGPLAIGIQATGYQDELDQCLWVRMDLAGASAPIVGAHHHCGGDILLAIEVGDPVELSGQDLDGRYVAIGSRDARPGQDAGEATEGMGAEVILQTCYPSGTEVRLIALALIS